LPEVPSVARRQRGQSSAKRGTLLIRDIGAARTGSRKMTPSAGGEKSRKSSYCLLLLCVQVVEEYIDSDTFADLFSNKDEVHSPRQAQLPQP
jgi:hypothetical protein